MFNSGAAYRRWVDIKPIVGTTQAIVEQMPRRLPIFTPHELIQTHQYSIPVRWHRRWVGVNHASDTVTNHYAVQSHRQATEHLPYIGCRPIDLFVTNPSIFNSRAVASTVGWCKPCIVNRHQPSIGAGCAQNHASERHKPS